jgi:hypothetical protein
MTDNQRHIIRLRTIIKEELKGDVRDLMTRQTGQKIFERIERELKEQPSADTVVFDFSGVGVIDYSCADEVIAKLISRLQLNEYGNKFFVIQHLTPTQRENIQVALERKNLAVMGEENNTWNVIGVINDYLLRTLEIVMKKGSVSSSELSTMLDLELNTASTRLINLHKLKLAKKIPEIDAKRGNRYFIYKSVLS